MNKAIRLLDHRTLDSDISKLDHMAAVDSGATNDDRTLFFDDVGQVLQGKLVVAVKLTFYKSVVMEEGANDLP